MASREFELERALGTLLDACIREFGWLPDAPENTPVGNNPECELTWGDLQSANRTLNTATRPAPAATDTGLETVEHQYWHTQTYEWLPTGFPDRYRKDGFLVRELVTRSQAEELLAAERARYVEASQRATNEESLKDTMHRGLLRWKERAEKAEADNAAKDARLSEVENSLFDAKDIARNASSNCIYWRGQTEALEAKLAAAVKALQEADEALQADAIASAHAAIRAVLGGKPL